MGTSRLNGFPLASAILLGALAALGGSAAAQTSASYKLEEHVLNMGGRPSDGMVATSASFRVSLDSLGESLSQTGLTSASFSMDGGLLPAYAPPGEALNLAFLDHDTLDWDAHPSADVYHLYRDALSTLSASYAGTCEQTGLPSSTTTDAGVPVAGDTWFYLVTMENRLGEEGTRGVDGSGIERVDTGVCP